MVTVFLRGGLGNQMFQYAAGFSLAKKRNDALSLDTVLLNDRFPRPGFTYRTYDLDLFSINPRLTKLSLLSGRIPLPGLWLGMDFIDMEVKVATGKKTIIREKEIIKSDKSVFFQKEDVILWGFWQSESYFEDYKDDVRTVFSFRFPLLGAATVLAEEIKNSESVAIHVRRGDYLSKKNRKLYVVTDIDYYKRAISYIGKKINNPRYFVFSDDMEWCKKNLRLPASAVYADAASSGEKGGDHLQLMSLCKHNIITNSSFSWWGAWLNKNKEKIIIAPQRWYTDPFPTSVDIVPGSWIKL